MGECQEDGLHALRQGVVHAIEAHFADRMFALVRTSDTPKRQENLTYSAPSLDASPKESGPSKAAKTATYSYEQPEPRPQFLEHHPASLPQSRFLSPLEKVRDAG